MDSKSSRISVAHFLNDITVAAGGVAAAASDICQEIVCEGIHVKVVCRRIDDVYRNRLSRVSNISVVEIDKSSSGLNLTNSSAQIDAALAPSDVVHLHGPWELENIRLAGALAQRHRPFVLSLHGMLDEWSLRQKRLKKAVFLNTIGRRLFRNVSLVHLTAQAELEQAQKAVPAIAGKATIIPCLVDLRPFECMPSKDLAISSLRLDQRPIVLFLSRVHPKKGLEILIDACGQLLRKGKDFQLIVAGPGQPDYVQRLTLRAQEQGLAEHIRFVGPITGDLKLSLYAAARVFALPTYQENFGLVLVESLLSETPVITTKNTDIWQELKAAGATLVCNDANAFAASIEKFIDNEQLAQNTGARGREFIRNWLDQTKIADAYRNMYRSVVAKNYK